MLAVSSTFETNSVSIQMYEDFQTKFLQTLNSRNSPGNIYEAALTMHVLIQLKLNETESNIPKFMDFILRKQQIDGSFESILAAYLVLPVLSGRNLLQIGKQCGPRPQTDITPIEVLKSPEHQNNSVKYILSIGNPAEISQILQIQVQEGINLLDVMKMAQDISPQYRFLLNENQEFPEVYSIGGIPNDAEKGMIWRLYVTTSVNSSDVNENHMTPYAGNIKDIFPKEEDEILFWYKPT
ncbi:uncharacterized protein TNIN_208611 [Trichonephila inaurata madagascariensis]|uniref:DUF4430 domain-containing protein n=1 Tax=Trichonephila inaurata madagascariensis TaxID=2747483 RepID=A0A8X7C166_9ARAC|nr:uncharacterized protein TNIN_208611 [Trichonephila inaurata madagascariensis]